MGIGDGKVGIYPIHLAACSMMLAVTSCMSASSSFFSMVARKPIRGHRRSWETEVLQLIIVGIDIFLNVIF